MNNDAWAVLGAVLGFILVLSIIFIATAVVLYILRAIGLMKIAKNRGMTNAWMAWIPCLNEFLLGAIADDIKEKEGGQSYYRFILLGISFVNYALAAGITLPAVYNSIDSPDAFVTAVSGLSGLSSLVSLALYVLSLICLHNLFQHYEPKNTILWTVLCALPVTSVMQSIFPFVLRNRQPAPPLGYYGYSGPAGYPPQGPYAGAPGYPPYGGQPTYPPPPAGPPPYSGYPPQPPMNRPPYNGQPPQQ